MRWCWGLTGHADAHDSYGRRRHAGGRFVACFVVVFQIVELDGVVSECSTTLSGSGSIFFAFSRSCYGRLSLDLHGPCIRLRAPLRYMSVCIEFGQYTLP